MTTTMSHKYYVTISHWPYVIYFLVTLINLYIYINFMKHVLGHSNVRICKNAQFWKHTNLDYMLNCEWYMCDDGPYKYTHIAHYMTNYGTKLYIFLCL